MRKGKVSETIFNRSIQKQIQYRSERAVCGPLAGEDCGRFDVSGSSHMAFCVKCVTGDAGWLAQKAFYRMANQITAQGAEIDGMLVSLLLPEQTEEKELKYLMAEICRLSDTYQVDLLGINAEVLCSVTEPLLSLTGFGSLRADVDVKGGNLQPGYDIVMTKWAGASGAAEIVKREKKALNSRFSKDFLERTEEYYESISSMKDAEIAVRYGASAVYPASEGGIFDALWEMGAASGVGFEVDLKKIPIRQETVEICEFFDYNPYQIPSDGVLLIGVPQGEKLVEKFTSEGIPAAVIGEVKDNRDRVVINKEERRYLVPPGSAG